MRMQKWLQILLINIFTNSSTSFSSQAIRDYTRVMNNIIASKGSYLIDHKLSRSTSFYGIKLWIIVTASAAVAFLLVVMVFLSLYFICHRRRCRQEPFRLKRSKLCLPLSHSSSEDKHQNPYKRCVKDGSRLSITSQSISVSSRCSAHLPYTCSILSSTGGFSSFTVFTFMEIPSVTNGFSEENLIAQGDSAMVYRGILMGNVTVSVKRFLSIDQRYEDEDFITRAEMIANVRHKNVMRLLGYCIEGEERVLVYEYAEKGDLHEWLHGSAGQVRPLTWRKRVNIIQGVAKGLAYFHEDIEPRITHQDMKPSKILLDYQWNPKILDVGFTSRSIPGHTDILTWCSSSNLEVKNDIYCFGTLIMELVSGRVSIDQSTPHVYLVDWIKDMVANHMIVNVLDPRLPRFPKVKELKRLVLIALRCVDPEVDQRPKIGDVIHMLQPHDLLLSNARQKKPQKVTRTSEIEEHMSEASCNQYQNISMILT